MKSRIIQIKLICWKNLRATRAQGSSSDLEPGEGNAYYYSPSVPANTGTSPLGEKLVRICPSPYRGNGILSISGDGARRVYEAAYSRKTRTLISTSKS